MKDTHYQTMLDHMIKEDKRPTLYNMRTPNHILKVIYVRTSLDFYIADTNAVLLGGDIKACRFYFKHDTEEFHGIEIL